jgi:GTP-dependent phosphoenolpyruvate carboxykinase
MMMEMLLWMSLAFLLPFAAIVAGAHYDHWLNRKHRRRKPRVLDANWRGRDGNHF